MMKLLGSFATLWLLQGVFGLDNGLARTPPMGWMHWQRFRCVIDCELYPDECVSEQLFRKMADLMASEGYLEAGYDYIIVDDCWASKNRSETNELVSDPIRFPSGMKALGDYIHNKGLKFGLYGDYGEKTCAGYPGSIHHLKLDADTFAKWGVDYVKLDGCYADPNIMEDGYAEYGRYLNETGRPMVYSCSWPAYQEPLGNHSDYKKLAETCNLWRNWDDIDDAWDSVAYIVDWFSKNQDRLVPYHGPGHWNDPDMLIIGNYGLTQAQSVAQMTIWSVMGAPLIMSNDLRYMEPQFKEILLNRDAIAINQDPLGKYGVFLKTINKVHVWKKEIQSMVTFPEYKASAWAVGLVSNRTDGFAYHCNVSLTDIELNAEFGYTVQNIFEKDQPDFSVTCNGTFSVRVKPTGGVLLKFTPIPKQ